MGYQVVLYDYWNHICKLGKQYRQFEAPFPSSGSIRTCGRPTFFEQELRNFLDKFVSVVVPNLFGYVREVIHGHVKWFVILNLLPFFQFLITVLSRHNACLLHVHPAHHQSLRMLHWCRGRFQYRIGQPPQWNELELFIGSAPHEQLCIGTNPVSGCKCPSKWKYWKFLSVLLYDFP